MISKPYEDNNSYWIVYFVIIVCFETVEVTQGVLKLMTHVKMKDECTSECASSASNRTLWRNKLLFMSYITKDRIFSASFFYHLKKTNKAMAFILVSSYTYTMLCSQAAFPTPLALLLMSLMSRLCKRKHVVLDIFHLKKIKRGLIVYIIFCFLQWRNNNSKLIL